MIYEIKACKITYKLRQKKKVYFRGKTQERGSI